MYIRLAALYEFKQDNNNKSSAGTIFWVYGEGLITDRPVRNWFFNFLYGDTILKYNRMLKHHFKYDDNLLEALLEQNPHP